MNQHKAINATVRLRLSDMVPVVFRSSVRQVKWGIVVLGVGVLAEALYFYRQNATSFLAPLSVITLSLPVLLLLDCYLTTRSVLKNNPSYRGDFQYSFSDKGIEVEGIYSKGNLSWNALHHVVETQRAFLLFHDKYNAQVLPKRCFASESDSAALRVLIQAHVPNTNLRTGEKIAKQ